jgi:endoglucanase
MNEYNVLPTDTVENRIIVSVHAYTPYDFALNGAGTGEFEINSTFSRQIPLFLNTLYEYYVAKGIPVVVGEFGARDKGGNLQARVHFASYYVFHATNRGIICCWWDNHGFQGDGELFGLMDRKTATWKYPEIVEAMLLNAPAID